MDSVTLRTLMPADEIAVSHLPAGEDLKKGDEGAVVDAVHRDWGWVTVEGFRNGKTGAVTDLPLTRLRLLWKASAARLHPSQRNARPTDRTIFALARNSPLHRVPRYPDAFGDVASFGMWYPTKSPR